MNILCHVKTPQPSLLFDVYPVKNVNGAILSTSDGLHFSANANEKIYNVYFSSTSRLALTDTIYCDTPIQFFYDEQSEQWIGTLSVSTPSIEELHEFISTQHGISNVIIKKLELV
jgi:hypothetical protein